MKRTLFSFAAACFALTAFGIAASQPWVSNYVAQAIARSNPGMVSTHTNNVTTYSMTIGGKAFTIELEDSTDAALVAANCTSAAISAGVTNGLLFVWNGSGSYVNPAAFVTSTSSNLVFEGVTSVATNGVERFDGYFDAEPLLIQPSRSFSITNSAAGGSL